MVQFVFDINNNTLKNPIEEEKIIELYTLLSDTSNFKICACRKDVDNQNWTSFELEATKNLSEFVNNSFSINWFLDMNNFNFIDTYFSWAIYALDHDKKQNILLGESKYLYFIETESEELKLNYNLKYSEINADSSFDKQEAMSNLTVLMHYTNQLVNNELVDEHDPVIINKDRTISFLENKNIVINKDNYSQEITFQMPISYDNIDLRSKQLYIYFIAPTGEPYKEKLQILTNNELEEKEEKFEAVWTVQLPATISSGEITFAIIAEGADLDNYFWQTFPSKFIVHQGIFENKETGEFQTTSEDSKYANLIKDIKQLQEYFEQGVLIWQTLADSEDGGLG